ncbi:hypothetical protein ABXS75_00195 [Roseburia hominis]
MKRLKMSAPYVAAAVILLVGVLSSKWISYVLPSYLDEVKVYDKTSGAGALYVGEEELFIWPWNGYSEANVREVEDDGKQEEMTEVFREISRRFGAPAASSSCQAYDKNVQRTYFSDGNKTAPNWKIDDKNFLYLKDYTYSGADGKEYICNMVWEEGGSGLIYYHNVATDMEKGTDEEVTAAVEEIKKWREPIFLYQDDYAAVEEEPGDREDMAEIPDDEFHGSLLMDFLELYWNTGEADFEMKAYENVEIRNRTTQLLLSAKEDILVYGNELLVVYSEDDMGTVIIYYSPSEKRITGFSAKIVW